MEKQTFTFTNAFMYLIEGRKVRRHDWHREAFMQVVDNAIEDEDANDFCFICHSSDILADDWELAE